MKFRRWITHIIPICIFILPVGLYAQDLTFDDFDHDGDGKIERFEFQTEFIANYTNDWDKTDDTGLDDEDFFTSTFAIVDANDDNMIAIEEWNFGYDYYYGDHVVDDFWVYDIDGDDYLTYSEYLDALYDTDYFYVWDVDRDTFLSEYELSDAVFENWDLNDNNVLSKSEFNRFDAYYFDI